MAPLLEVRGLTVSFATEEGTVRAVDGVDLDLGRGEVLALVGESGCGKSATALAVMGLSHAEGATIGGEARFEGVDTVAASEEELRRLRGDRIAMVFQDPMTSLNPVHRIGDQIAEQIRAHRKIGSDAARQRAVELMAYVGIPDPGSRVDANPHQLSGGLRQRAMIAMALSLEPDLLIADEPTTGLDVTIQAQILELLRELNRSRGLAILLITHDIGVVAESADRVAVMYAGEIVEQGALDEVFYDAQHPYAWGLLASVMRLDRPRPARLPQIAGAPPSLLDPPSGCRFRPRCAHAFDRCIEHPTLEPRLAEAPGHLDRCWLSPEEKRERR